MGTLATWALDASGTTQVWVKLPVYLCVYLFPAYVAHRQRLRHRKAIAIIDVLFGWTTVGWMCAAILVAIGCGVGRRGPPRYRL